MYISNIVTYVVAHHFIGGPRVNPRVHLPRLPRCVLHVGDAHSAAVQLKKGHMVFLGYCDKQKEDERLIYRRFLGKFREIDYSPSLRNEHPKYYHSSKTENPLKRAPNSTESWSATSRNLSDSLHISACRPTRWWPPRPAWRDRRSRWCAASPAGCCPRPEKVSCTRYVRLRHT